MSRMNRARNKVHVKYFADHKTKSPRQNEIIFVDRARRELSVTIDCAIRYALKSRD